MRQEFMNKRKALAPETVEEFSQAIVAHFRKLNLSDVRFLHIFYPIVGKHEFNSLLLAAYIKENFPDISLVLPKSNLQNCSLTHIIWDEQTPLSMNKWGITEPEEGEAIHPEKIDMAVIPLLAFDEHGHRLGYGKGFYDRFLSQCRKNVQKIGVSFFPPIPAIETDPYDIPLDMCVTPEKIWDFKKNRKDL